MKLNRATRIGSASWRSEFAIFIFRDEAAGMASSSTIQRFNGSTNFHA